MSDEKFQEMLDDATDGQGSPKSSSDSSDEKGKDKGDMTELSKHQKRQLKTLLKNNLSSWMVKSTRRKLPRRNKKI